MSVIIVLFFCISPTDLGLKTVKECKSFEDAVCGVLEGNYCTDSYEGGCRAAKKHTTCKPGHFIRQPGLTGYEIDGRCCPMCTPGYHVIEHCTASDMTLCRPCPESTFTDKPHGRRICNPCTTCNHGLGLKTVKECKPSSDTACGVLEGNYCIDPYEGECRAAQKHTTCKPGHFIKHPGTDSKDTVCESCPENSYSNGSSTSCTPHTDCESEGRPTVKTGDSVSDSVCGEKNLMPIVAGTTVGVILMVFLVQIGLRLYQLKFCQRETPPVCLV
uniref:TNFR-Cys domain-containing protein n=1 Tax=Scleropages formosus TaxID=113540 RepID=A0A8C9R537_SCLFO